MANAHALAGFAFGVAATLALALALRDAATLCTTQPAAAAASSEGN
jgi:hypothetical protein